ncbi:MAG: CHAT domain-containing protein [Candidatus Njordarchaeales archaeon]
MEIEITNSAVRLSEKELEVIILEIKNISDQVIPVESVEFETKPPGLLYEHRKIIQIRKDLSPRETYKIESVQIPIVRTEEEIQGVEVRIKYRIKNQVKIYQEEITPRTLHTLTVSLRKTGEKKYAAMLRFQPTPYILPLAEISSDIKVAQEIYDFIKRKQEIEAQWGIERLEVDHIKGLGQILYKNLGRITEIIKGHRPRYIIFELDKDTYEIPIEFLHDGEEFLALRHAIGRVIISEEQGELILNTLKRHKKPRIRNICAIISYVEFDEGGRKSLKEEAKHIMWLGKKGYNTTLIEVDEYKVIINREEEILAQKDRKREIMTRINAAQPDILYISAHGEWVGNEQTIKISRNPENNITTKDIEKLVLEKAPIVFANICYGGKILYQGKEAYGLATAFHKAGAAAYIGPILKVETKKATEFMKNFLDPEIIEQEKTIGEWLRRTRQKTRDEKDPTWILYTLYADPTLKT